MIETHWVLFFILQLYYIQMMTVVLQNNSYSVKNVLRNRKTDFVACGFE